MKRTSGLRLVLLATLALVTTLAVSVAPARSALPEPTIQQHALPAPVGAVTQAYVDAVAPAPQPSSNATSLGAVLNPDGSLRGGLSGSFNAEGYAIAYGADGGPRFVPNATSSPMTGGYASFAINTPSSVNALVVSGSDVYVGGGFTDLGGIAEADRIAKWNGSAWSALGGGTQGIVNAIAVSGSDVYVGGQFTSVYSSGTTPVTRTGYIAKWNTSTSTWSALGGGANETVNAITVSGSDVYVGGRFSRMYRSGTITVPGTGYIAKWDGSAWSALGGGANLPVHALVVSGSDVYVGGQFTSVYSSGTTPVDDTRGIAKWNTSTSTWSALGGGAGYVNAIAVSGSDVYVGGLFSSVYSSGTTPVTGTSRIAKWNGSAWSALGGGAQNQVLAIAVSGSDVYVGGQFTSVYSSGTTPVTGTSRIAKWNGRSWSALGGGAQSAIFAITVSGSNVYVGGGFTSVYSSGTTPVDGTVHIAKWDDSAWRVVVPQGSEAVNDDVHAIVVRGSYVYVGGAFKNIGGLDDADYIARWNSATSSWSALGSTGVDPGVGGRVNAIAVSGSDVYVGGYFRDFGGIAGADNIARWDGRAWSALGGGLEGGVHAIAVSGSDVYVGGNFRRAYNSDETFNQSVRYFARWNRVTSTWGPPLGNPLEGGVRAIVVSGDDVYVGGWFKAAAGIFEANYIAKWNMVTSTWSALGNGVNAEVWALAVSGSDVYAGGYFTNVEDIPEADRIAKWNTVTSTWSALGGGANGSVNAIAVSGSDVYVGGGFYNVYMSGRITVPGTGYIAKWDGSTWSALGSGVNNAVLALALGTAEPAPAAVWGDAPAVQAARAPVPALYLGGMFTAAGDGTPTGRFTYYTGPEITPVGNEPEEHVVNGAGPLVIVLGNGGSSPRVRIEGTGAVRAEVYDVLGRSVGVVYDGAVLGTVEASLPASLAVGAYVVRVVSDGRTTSRTVVVR